MLTKHIQFRLDTPLESRDVKILVKNFERLFSTMKATPDTGKLLEFNPELKEVIEKI